MDLYYVGKADNEIKSYMKKLKANRLLSYVLDKKEIINSLNDGIPIFMDSGAFSAFTKGKKINIDEYIEFINSYGDKLKLIASLDVINEPLQSYNNYEYIYNKINYKDKLIPCFHFGEPLEYLDRYLKDSKIKYLAIGGLAGNKKNQNRNSIEGIVNYIRNKNKTIKIHIFGISNVDLINDLDITSIDSSTWIRRAIYGDILNPVDGKAYHLGNKNKLKIEEYKDLINNDTKAILKDLSLTFENLKDSASNRTLFNLISFQKYLTKLTINQKIKRKLF